MKCKEMRIYFFLFLVLWAGSVYAKNQPVILDKHNVIELNDAKEWNRFIKSWEAVPLKMDARNAVEIQSLAVYDDLVVVRGIRDQWENILLFDISGKFLRQIGSQGGGKEQYGMVGWVRVDPLEREIGVYDGFLRKRYVTYDFEGDFKEDGACEEYMHYVRGVYPLEKDRYLGYITCSKSKLCYFISDKKFTKFDTLRPHYVRFPMGVVDFSRHPITIYDGRISFVTPLCDTIFEYDGHKLQPRFVTKVHRSVPDNFDPGQKDYLTCVARLEKEKGYFSKDEIYETKNWFIITYEAGKLIYNKKMEKAFYMPKNVAMRGDMIYPDDLWGEYGEKLVAVYTPEELLAMRDKMKKEGVVLTKKVEQLFRQVEAEKNPVMILYVFK